MTLTSQTEAEFKAAGKTIDSDDYEDLEKQAESRIILETRYDFVENYDKLKDNTKGILSEAASNLIAIYIIANDIDHYSTRTTAETILQVLRTNYQDCIEILRDQKTTTYIKE